MTYRGLYSVRSMSMHPSFAPPLRRRLTMFVPTGTLCGMLLETENQLREGLSFDDVLLVPLDTT